MLEFKEHDVVRVKKVNHIQSYQGIKVGDKGTIVHVYKGFNVVALAVEFKVEEKTEVVNFNGADVEKV